MGALVSVDLAGAPIGGATALLELASHCCWAFASPAC
jgi:hypothetical protein